MYIPTICYTMSSAIHTSGCSPTSFPPLPSTPTLSSPLNNYTLEIIKFDINTPVPKKPRFNTNINTNANVSNNPNINNSIDFPPTPTMPSPPFTPLVKPKTYAAEISTPPSPGFLASPPKTPLISFKKKVDNIFDESPLPSTPKFSSPPFTPLVKGYQPKDDDDTPTQFDSSLSSFSTPTMESPPTSTYLRGQISKFQLPQEEENESDFLPPLPETPTLASPTFTPLMFVPKDNDGTPSFHASPLPETPTFKSPPKTPYLSVPANRNLQRDKEFEQTEDFYEHMKDDNMLTPIASSPLGSPLGFNHSPVPVQSFLSPSALECDRTSRSRNAAWKF